MSAAPQITQVGAGLDELVSAVRAVLRVHSDWRERAGPVARALRHRLPPLDVLTDEQRCGDPDGYRNRVPGDPPSDRDEVVLLIPVRQKQRGGPAQGPGKANAVTRESAFSS